MNRIRELLTELGEIYEVHGKHHGARCVAERFMEQATDWFQSGNDEKATVYREMSERADSIAHRLSIEAAENNVRMGEIEREIYMLASAGSQVDEGNGEA